MRRVFELILFTLFFSILGGFGITAGFFCFYGVASMLRGVIG